MSIELKNVTYTYMRGTAFERTALKDITLTLKENSLTAIAGHTGSGKSTLVQHLNGLLHPTSGVVTVDGTDIAGKSKEAVDARRKVGLVFQYPEHQLFAETVLADVCYGPKNQGLDKKECELRAYDALKKVGFPEDFIYSSPFDLSGGQKRRVAIAGVLAMNPEVLILDEPTAGLDPKGRDEILGLIKELQKTENMTILLVSHSMEDVAEYVDRIVVMNKGEIFLDNTPREVFSHYKELEAIGLSAPQVTYIMHALREKGLNVSEEITTIGEAADEILRALGKTGK